MQLQRGEKRSLADLGIADRCQINVDFGITGVDIAAFGLNSERKIGDDRYVVLFSNKSSPEGAITLESHADQARFTLNLSQIPASVDRVVFTATHENRPVSESRPLVVHVGSVASFNVAEHLTTEKAVMMIEVYRHSTGWRIGTIAAGFAGGLASLIKHFGGEVDRAPTVQPARPTASPPPPPPVAPVSLRKITLEKANPTVSLEKKSSGFGEIVLNLNWSQGPQKRGFFSSGPKSIDLDLGVLFEMQDGYRGVIQALGRQFGDFHGEPFIELSGDDRTGAVSAGETIRVNGRHFDRIKRIGVFALIYDGVPNWQQTDGIVRLTMPDQPEIELRMDEGRDNCRLCGIALIENIGGNLQVKRHMSYYRDQKHFADDIGIHLRWTVGSKD